MTYNVYKRVLKKAYNTSIDLISGVFYGRSRVHFPKKIFLSTSFIVAGDVKIFLVSWETKKKKVHQKCCCPRPPNLFGRGKGHKENVYKGLYIFKYDRYFLYSFLSLLYSLRPIRKFLMLKNIRVFYKYIECISV